MNLQKFDIYYIIGLAISTVIMLIVLLSGINSLNITFLIFFWVIKFLSGFGLILGITSGFLFLLNKSKDKLSKRGTNLIIAFQIIVPILLIIYAIYKIFSSYSGPATSVTMTGVWRDIYVWFDNIVYIYGIISLLLQLYIIPILTKTFDEAINKGRNQKLGSNIKNFGRNIKKQWFKWKKEDAKVQIIDQKSIKELLDNWRDRFAIILLIPLAIGSLLFVPITFVLIIMWCKIIIWDRSNINVYEKLGTFISIIFIGLIAILVPYFNLGIYSNLTNSLWSINIFYFIGIVLATLIFIIKLLSLQGVSIGTFINNRRGKKKENIKEEIKDLKQEKKQLEEGQVEEGQVEEETSTNP